MQRRPHPMRRNGSQTLRGHAAPPGPAPADTAHRHPLLPSGRKGLIRRASGPCDRARNGLECHCTDHHPMNDPTRTRHHDSERDPGSSSLGDQCRLSGPVGPLHLRVPEGAGAQGPPGRMGRHGPSCAPVRPDPRMACIAGPPGLGLRHSAGGRRSFPPSCSRPGPGA